MKLRMKMLVFIVVPVVILTAVSSFYSYYQSKAALEKQIMDTSNAQISYFSQELNRDLIVRESVVKNLAAIFSNKDLSTEEMLSLVTATKKGDPSLAEVFAGMADGRGIFDNWTPPPEWVPSVRPWYKEAIKGDTVAYSPIYEDLITKDLLVTVGHPIYRNGQKVGVAGIDISLKPILAKTENMKTGETSYTFVLNSVGDFITHPKYQKTDNIANINNEELYNFYQTVLKDGIAVRTIKVDGVEEFVRGSKIGNTGWVIANAIDVNELYAPVKKMMVTLVIMGVIIIALLVGVISTFTLNISKAIDQMKDFANKLAEGDFAKCEFNINREDEIGSLGRALVSMRDRLRDVISKVSSSAQMVAASSEELTASSDESSQSSAQIIKVITDVAMGADKQVLSVETALGTVERIVKEIDNMSKSSAEMAGKASEMAEKAGVGNQIVNKAIGQMDSLGKSVDTSSVLIGQLGERSKEIGEIVNTISGIAGQTNLLALNAAIEAARAGEHGRGFAVVADEVRKLAEQSQVSAKHISELIGKIQNDTQSVVKSMNVGTTEVKAGAEAVNNAGTIFRDIYKMIGEVNREIIATQKAVEEMIKASNEADVAVMEIEEISKKTAEGTGTASAATEEQSATIQEVAGASRALAELAQELQKLVNSFKI
ncbi:MAG: methyl-accepting chemotaxis protein [Negativicutes bacterium]|nr:methyl-accepting chemotaxis protein [Negativicutes bacterium]